MLLALCEPLLLYAGEDARPASQIEIAERLGVSAEYVRQTLAALRDRLSSLHGVPRLRAGDGVLPRAFTDSLADWAIRTGVASRETLAELDRPDR
jgi:hypothetical protein